MMNKRGFVFALLLVFITLFLCASVVLLYAVQQRNADNSLVSPKVVLDVRDDLELFEMREDVLIESLVGSIGGDFGDDDFIVEFRNGFLDGVIGDEKMSEFIFSDLVFGDGGWDFEDDARRLAKEVLDVNLYSDMVNVDGELVFSRNKIGKRVVLKASDESKINFPVWFEFEFARDYLVAENGVVE